MAGSGRLGHLVVTMGGGDTCPIFPGIRYANWEVADPDGQGLSIVRRIRDDIAQRVRVLLDEIDVRTE